MAYGFPEGHNMWQSNRCGSSTERNVVATKPEFLIAKDEMLVSLGTVLVAISSPGMAFKILCLC